MNRQEIESRQFSIKMKIARLKKKSFATTGERNGFLDKTVKPLQNELLRLSELWGKA